MAYNVTSEWEDIQVKFGNYLPREKELTNDEIQKIAIEAVETYDPMEKKTISELEDLEDKEEEEILRQYKEKRLNEMKAFATKPKFGSVIELRRQDFIQEVNNAPKDVFVVLLLYQTFNDSSNLLDTIFQKMAVKYPLIKFMRIVANNCIENYQDQDVPGIIVYQNGSLFKQFIPAPQFFGGKKITMQSM